MYAKELEQFKLAVQSANMTYAASPAPPVCKLHAKNRAARA
jgi:hypothetical protein